ncbi:MAG: acetyl-CoA hydrolase/transferase family protein, partial [Deltaproteobacteria bacterium]|nr:acetyl-CoA hydrolase/transferase family protein [Deltaproteobacteria bacterium]
MAVSIYWADNYVEKRCSGKKAIGLIRSGQRVFIGSSCGEPQYLVRELAEAADTFTDIEIVRLLSLESTPLTLIADESRDQSFNIRSFYLGSAKTKSLAKNMRFITPMNLSAVPRLFETRRLPIHVALIQVSPPDDFGWMSLGISVDITLAAAISADLVIAQVNSRMPRVLGRSFIHVNDVDAIVECEEALLTVGELPELDAANLIGRLVERLVDDGSTIQFSPGTTPQATLLALSDKNDIGVHTQYLTTDIMHLVSMGVITNRKKGFNNGKLVASSAIGTKNLYEFLDDNPAIEFHPSDYVNDPGVISRHNKMVSMNVPMAMDLTGQVAADALSYNHFSGVTGYGAVNLFGKSLQERAMAMISIAHPDFREELFFAARKMGLLG